MSSGEFILFMIVFWFGWLVVSAGVAPSMVGWWLLAGIGLNIGIPMLVKWNRQKAAEKTVQETIRAEEEHKQQLIERYGKLGVEDILLNEEMSEWDKPTMLLELHNLMPDEAEELLKSTEQAKRKAKLSNIKRSVRRRAYELRGELPSDSREPIPEEVKSYVWDRDKGKCVRCSSNESLEYDHIIPVAKGGSNTARNLQLLCEGCNRTKSDEI